MRKTVSAVLALMILLACAAPVSIGAEKASPSFSLSAQLRERGRQLLMRRQAFLRDLLYGRVPESAPVDPSWFDDAAFVGDSVSVMLEYYNNAYHPLGNAAFFCAESLNARSALWSQPGSKRLPEWPKGSGQRPTIPDGVAQSGAKKVYVMMGINSISGGVDNAAGDLVTLIDAILEQSPEAVILVQSVFPMTTDSPRADEQLNNWTIGQYNRRLVELCRERGWYYIDAAQAMTDENGALRADYSGDKAMGIHLNFTGTEAWANYLLTHVPLALK